MFGLRQIAGNLLGAILSVLLIDSSAAAPSAGATIVDTIKANVAQLVAGINAHDPDRATMFDAPDIVSMESGRPPSVGAAADKQGISGAFQYSPSWHLTLIDEIVDVSKDSDMAVYRSTYDEDSVEKGVPMTHRVNFIAGFRTQPDGSWKIAWSVVCAQGRSHAK